jgi:putative DNA primase/helicase
MLPITLDGCPDVTNQFTFTTANGSLTGFRPQVMGSWLLDTWNIVKGTDGELYRWFEGKYWLAEETIGAAVVGKHEVRYQRGRAEDVVNWLKKMPALDVSKPLDDGLLNVRNGVLVLETGELLSGGPEYLTTIQLPVEWDPKAECPFGDWFLGCSVAPDSVDLVWEMVGYCLSGTNKFQRSFLLYGPGGNGKSKLLALLNGLLGDDNYSANSLQSLSSNRFRCAQLYGKLANVCGDISKDLIENTETFKQLVGGDPIEVEKKGQNPFTMHNRAVLVFSANEFPKVTDHSQGYFERFVFVSMPVKFRGTEREIVAIEKKLCREDELRGALVRAVEGLRRLEGRGRFPVVESSAQVLREYRMEVDSVEGFVQNCVSFEVESEMAKKDMYTQYVIWCEGNGVSAKSSVRFWREFRNNYNELYIELKRDGYMWLRGCKVSRGVCLFGL